MTNFFAVAIAISFSLSSAVAQNPPETRQNPAVVPVSRTGSVTNRQNHVLEYAKAHPGDYDLEFIGDSITEGWETRGKNVWNELGGKYKIINMGVGGDRTEHVLWRFGQGQLDGIHAKAAVVMIGTNNSNKNKNGTEQYSTPEILAGVEAVVNQIRTRQPDTKVLLFGIFPRGREFNEQRGRLLEINEVLAKLDDGKNIFYLDIGSQLIEKDGAISQDMMRDALHPGETGYKIWDNAIEVKYKEIFGAK